MLVTVLFSKTRTKSKHLSLVFNGCFSVLSVHHKESKVARATKYIQPSDVRVDTELTGVKLKNHWHTALDDTH